MNSIPGGFGPWRDADADVKKICEKIKPQVEKKEGKTFPVFLGLHFRTQVVAGVNYEIKVYAGDDQCVILEVWKKLNGELKLSKSDVRPMEIMCGGWGPWNDSGADMEKICEKIKPEVEKKLGKKFPVFLGLRFRTQVVAGLNYEIKVYAGDDQCVILVVWEKLDGELELGKSEFRPLPGV